MGNNVSDESQEGNAYVYGYYGPILRWHSVTYDRDLTFRGMSFFGYGSRSAQACDQWGKIIPGSPMLGPDDKPRPNGRYYLK